MSSDAFTIEQDFCFACTCLTAGAASLEEMQGWIQLCIAERDPDTIPGFFFDVLDVKDRLELKREIDHRHLFGDSGIRDGEQGAIDGIAYLRNENHVSDAVSRNGGIAALVRHPQIAARFKRLFPHVTDLPDWDE